jgi:hypothetical protein
MLEQVLFDRLRRDVSRSDPVVVPAGIVRLAGAVLALAIAGAHVADQGGITAFTAPDWLGWAFRLIEVGGVLTAVALIWPRTARLGWAAGVLLGVAPFLGFLASRTVGVPGDPGDVGNWSDWVGTLALVLEAGLATVSVGMLQARLRRPSPVGARDAHRSNRQSRVGYESRSAPADELQLARNVQRRRPMRFGGVAARPLDEPCVRCDPGDVGNWADWVGHPGLDCRGHPYHDQPG